MRRKQKAQGDLLFVPVPCVPAGQPLVVEDGRYILARGEATGHHHSVAVTPRVRAVVTAVGVTYLTIEELTEVQHQEHGSVLLEAGAWEVRRQREYDWDEEEIRNVAD